MVRRFLWRLGLASRREDADFALVAAAEQHMRESGEAPDLFFHKHRSGGCPPDGEFGDMLRLYQPTGDTDPLWSKAEAPSLVIDEVERIWAAIDQGDDWSPLATKIEQIRRLGNMLGEPPGPVSQSGGLETLA
jgi:hypothetical protein